MRYKFTFLVVILLISAPTLGQERYIAINIPPLLMGIYNIEGSIALSKEYSLHLPLSWSPTTLPGEKRVKHLIGMVGLRRWLWHSYSGLFTGAYATTSIFNISPKELRYQGEAVGVTATIGYSKMLSKRFNLEFEGGLFLGFIHYNSFEGRCCGEFLAEKSAIYLLPSKLSLALLYLF